MDTIDSRMDMFKRYLDKTNMEHKQYQYDGVRWCLNNELRQDPPCNVRGGFIADEMGLGKTIMMIGLMYSNFVPRTLVILPPILIDQWFLQIYKTTGHKALIYHGEAKKTITFEQLSAARIVISSYGAITLTKKQINDEVVTMIHRVSWNRIIFDEAHHLRNSKTTRYIGALLLPARIRWLVSGTPIQNSKKDFYSLCALVRLPASFYTDTSNLRLLAKSFILKRTKKQVGIVISDIHVGKSVVDWASQKEMALSEELHSALEFSCVNPQKGMNKQIVGTFRDKGILTLLLRAKQSCIYPKLMAKQLDKMVKMGFLSDYSSYKDAFDHSSKLDAAVNSILERKGNGCGKLIFCHFREEIDEIAKRLRRGGMEKVATFDGRTSNGKRYDILNDKNEALILQIQTGCEGLNLQENYSEIYFISPHWNPAVEDQAIARCHRIGQTKPVYVQRFEMSSFAVEEQEITTKTIDKYVNDVQEGKRIIASEILVE
ncbi:MAG: DEAD/DEAH box helicase [Chitinophagia bacterium]|nr:DEAD/DEAH box helicase [Chitinophagia bacterium]